MAFRFEKAIGAGVVLSFALLAQQAEVRHRHLYGGGVGVLNVTPDGVSFEESGKNKGHSYRWAWKDIQELELRRDRMKVLTYEDNKWNSGRDREYTFERLPDHFAEQARDRLRQNLREKFVDAMRSAIVPDWKVPAKLARAGWRGTNGVLAVARDRVVFEAVRPEDSRSWAIEEIQSVATAGPYDLAVVTLEKHGFGRAPGREFRFQLKTPLERTVYQQLWLAVERRKGLEVLSSYQGEGR